LKDAASGTGCEQQSPRSGETATEETGNLAAIKLSDEPVVCLFRQELQIFQNGAARQPAVLQFPEVISSYARLQLHQLVQQEFPQLRTVSFGKGKHRCCVVLKPEIELVKGSEEEDEEESAEATVKAIKAAIGPGARLIRTLTKAKAFDDAQNGCVSSSSGSDAAAADKLSHIVELYDFPVAHKTRDLDAVLHKFRTTQFYEIVWVDDTHALAVMSDKESAESVLQIQDPQVKIRPYTEASNQSKSKAKAIGLCDINSQKKRPKTSIVAANRLVSRALGLPTKPRPPRTPRS